MREFLVEQVTKPLVFAHDFSQLADKLSCMVPVDLMLITRYQEICI